VLPSLNLPASLLEVLSVLRPCFTAPGFVTFCGLVAGLAGRARRRTVAGMLLGAALQHAWPHDRAHYFFARARWELDQLGLAVAQVVVLALVEPGADLRVAVDDSVFRRSGRKHLGRPVPAHRAGRPGPAAPGSDPQPPVRRHHPPRRPASASHDDGPGGKDNISGDGLRIPLGDAPVPARGGQSCPPRIAAIRLTIAETARLERLASQHAAGLITRARLAFHLRWSRWRRRHQARARWHHYSTRLLATAPT
jgi:hypothetical protein